MKLLIGLGNPGAEHARNRHNIGFMAADAIAEAHGFDAWRNKFRGRLAEGRMGDEKCLLLKPSTYMNESGRAASEAVRFYKLGLDDVIVFHDELDLAPGKVRVKAGGGTAGHNGLRSLTRQIGNDYVRVRIGIGHPGHKAKVHSHVLKDFSKSEQAWVAPLVEAIAGAAPRLAEGDYANFMNEVALGAGRKDAKPPKKAREKAGPKRTGRPSQQQLARAAAERNAERERNSDTPQGPFARLRKMFGAGE